MTSISKKWFVMNEGVVLGPFQQGELESQLFQYPKGLIWGRGQTEWVEPSRWQVLLTEESSKKSASSERLWKVRFQGQEMTPMTQSQMMDFLRTKTDFSDVYLWTEGYSDWKEIYQIHKLMDELGVSRRAHPRVPIMGTLECDSPNGKFECRALSISEGGLGVTEAGQVVIGDKFKVVLKSPNLYTPIYASAEVVFVGQDNYAGLKFIGLHAESKSAIIEYVKKFTELKKN